MTWEKPKVHITQCLCEHDRDHNVVFTFYNEDEDSELYVSAGLNHYKGFFQRLWVGIKYALGIDNTYYAYTESVLDKDEIIRLRDYLNDVVDHVVGPEPKYELDDGPLTDEQMAAIRAAVPQMDASKMTRRLF